MEGTSSIVASRVSKSICIPHVRWIIDGIRRRWHETSSRFARHESDATPEIVRSRASNSAMSETDLAKDDVLDDFVRRTIAIDGIPKTVWVSGRGAAVVVLSEMPGISPHVARFARWVREAGFTVYMPSLFGRDGALTSAEEAVAVFRKACVSAEFRALEDNRPTPVTTWLRGLARSAHAECGGPGVGAVGMCFTGNFSLSMVLDSPTVAPVVCQPSLPLEDPASTGIPPNELVKIRETLERRDLSVLAFRFAGDKWCTAARFAAYSHALGERFESHVLPDSAAHPDPPPFFKHVVAGPHSVVTAHLIDEAGQPTIAARDEILAFLRKRLQGGNAA
jgi:dienelactone hydrolase